MEVNLNYLCGVLGALLTYTLYRVIEGTRYWARRGIPGPPVVPIFGSLWGVFLRKVSAGECWYNIYNSFKNERFIGAFNFIDPVLILTRPEDVETLLVREFSVFTDRSPPINEDVNPHAINLFSLTGKRWRSLRSKVTPTFTTGRIRKMIPEIAECWKNMDKHIEKNKNPHNIKDLTSMFAMDVIASIAFGIDSTKLGEINTEFRQKTMEFFDFNIIRLTMFMINILYPKLAGLLRMPIVPRRITNYFADITKQTIDFRRKNNISRNDFLQLMMQLQEKGNVEVTSWDADDEYLKMDEKSNAEAFEINENLIISQAIIFFTAGFESSANTVLFTLFEINQNPHVKEKVTQEVEMVFKKHGSLTYEALKDMTYLEQCIQESLRLHPAIFNLARESNKEFQFPNSNLKLKKGTTVGVSVFGLHTDERYWQEPFVYNPDRFGADKNIVPGTYLPFGNGPRMCIAMRFATLEVKIALAKLILNYNMELHPDTEIPIRSNKQSLLNSPVSPVLFNLTRKHEQLL